MIWGSIDHSWWQCPAPQGQVPALPAGHNSAHVFNIQPRIQVKVYWQANNSVVPPLNRRSSRTGLYKLDIRHSKPACKYIWHVWSKEPRRLREISESNSAVWGAGDLAVLAAAAALRNPPAGVPQIPNRATPQLPKMSAPERLQYVHCSSTCWSCTHDTCISQGGVYLSKK